MNWVAPIKDEKTLQAFEEALLKADVKYYIMFQIGVGTGIQLQDILKLKVKDVRDQDGLTVYIGTHKEKLDFTFGEELKKLIQQYTQYMDEDDYLFKGHKADAPLTREQAYRAIKTVSMSVGISSVGAQTMRKTFAWNYYKRTGDIYYLQRLFNHASPTITYRFIGEKPSVDIPMRKMTSSENELSRRNMCVGGKERIETIVADLKKIEDQIMNPMMPDSFYGSVECLLTQIEELTQEFHNVTGE